MTGERRVKRKTDTFPLGSLAVRPSEGSSGYFSMEASPKAPAPALSALPLAVSDPGVLEASIF